MFLHKEKGCTASSLTRQVDLFEDAYVLGLTVNYTVILYAPSPLFK